MSDPKLIGQRDTSRSVPALIPETRVSPASAEKANAADIEAENDASPERKSKKKWLIGGGIVAAVAGLAALLSPNNDKPVAKCSAVTATGSTLEVKAIDNGRISIRQSDATGRPALVLPASDNVKSQISVVLDQCSAAFERVNNGYADKQARFTRDMDIPADNAYGVDAAPTRPSYTLEVKHNGWFNSVDEKSTTSSASEAQNAIKQIRIKAGIQP